METFKPKHIQRWFEQINYQGDNFDDYYVAYWRFFRCTPLERSNFKFIRDHLSGVHELGAPWVIYPTFTDAVMMSRYYIMVHKDCTKGLRAADLYAGRVKQFGSLDPTSEAQLDIDSIEKRWHMLGLKGKVEICQEAGVSIFLARRYDFPGNPELMDVFTEAQFDDSLSNFKV